MAGNRNGDAVPLVNVLEAGLKKYWGYDSFRPLQREAIECVMQHRDSVVVLPTGGGKSLCFQLPALCMEGMAVVISPLIALMKDQVDTLRGMGVGAAAINSSLTESERREIAEDIRQRRLKILYVTPERLVQERFIEYLKNNHLTFIAVDEAHCISQWGHDFRPEYRALGALREAFPEAGIHAYTATATPQVRQDIAAQLQLRNAVFHTGPFDRPNLLYRVLPRDNMAAQLQDVLARNVGESGIIYCLRRKDVESTCASLSAQGHRALPYHAGMDNNARRRNQEAFIQGDADIIVATVAFGMGIDKPDVRFVLHTGLPKSIEHYQQESGRAGRDGLNSECVLLYSRADYMMWSRFAEKEGGEGAAMAIRKAGEMLEYCTMPKCRHRALTEYFGEKMRVEKCVSCDVCTGEATGMAESAGTARILLSAIRETGERFGGAYLAKVLCGDRDERIEGYRHHKLPSFGALSAHPAREVREWLDQLVAQGCATIEGEYRTLQLTQRGAEFLAGDGAESPILGRHTGTARATRAPKEILLSTPLDKALFDSLRALRLEIAHEEGVAPYIIFGDRTLVAIAVTRPTTEAGFAQVHGVGSIKHEKYASRFVNHVREWCDQNGADDNVAPSTSQASEAIRPRRTGRTMAAMHALTLFQQGMSIQDAAEELSRATSTVSNYLVDAIDDGSLTDTSPWISDDDLNIIRAQAEIHGYTRSGPIRDALNNEFTYEQIRIALAALRQRQT